VANSKLISLVAALVLTGAAALSDTPKRVVSINLCTDQQALMLAAPGQLVSVSKLAHDPTSSVMHKAAYALPTNNSGAEEAFLMQPDLVLAGTFNSAATVRMLKTLNVRVELFEPANSLADVPKVITQMGRALGQEARAAEIITAYETRLADLVEMPEHRPRAAITYVNSYTTGDKTLAGDILRAAGFDNVATEAGMDFGGTLNLEQMVMLAPDVIIRGRNYPGQARAEDNLTHPVLKSLMTTNHGDGLNDRDWICGTPHVLDAVEEIRSIRHRLEGRS
jgi:iron complex transport system substrate-binding protein